MGEARRRKCDIDRLKASRANWLSGLSQHQRLVYELSLCLADRLVKARRFYGGCYHLAFFKAKFLEENGVFVTPIVGWVNDGTWEGVGSHAWLEMEGKKTDISLAYTFDAIAQPTGGIIVHDYVVEKGQGDYTYLKNDSEGAALALGIMGNMPEIKSALRNKIVEHQRMHEIADNRAFDEYLAGAPRGMRYEDLRRIVDADLKV